MKGLSCFFFSALKCTAESPVTGPPHPSALTPLTEVYFLPSPMGKPRRAQTEAVKQWGRFLQRSGVTAGRKPDPGRVKHPGTFSGLGLIPADSPPGAMVFSAGLSTGPRTS